MAARTMVRPTPALTFNVQVLLGIIYLAQVTVEKCLHETIDAFALMGYKGSI